MRILLVVLSSLQARAGAPGAFRGHRCCKRCKRCKLEANVPWIGRKAQGCKKGVQKRRLLAVFAGSPRGVFLGRKKEAPVLRCFFAEASSLNEVAHLHSSSDAS